MAAGPPALRCALLLPNLLLYLYNRMPYLCLAGILQLPNLLLYLYNRMPYLSLAGISVQEQLLKFIQTLINPLPPSLLH